MLKNKVGRLLVTLENLKEAENHGRETKDNEARVLARVGIGRGRSGGYSMCPSSSTHCNTSAYEGTDAEACGYSNAEARGYTSAREQVQRGADAGRSGEAGEVAAGRRAVAQ